MPDEIELLRMFRDDTPGPAASAWDRAESAIDEVRSAENRAGRGPRSTQPAGLRAGRLPGLLLGRRQAIAACAVAAIVAGVLAVVLPGTTLTRPVHTAWQPAHLLPTSPAMPGGPAGTWRLASYLGSSGWQEHTAGPETGPLTCPTAQTCYVEGDNAASSSGPADMNSLYVSDDGAASWSVVALPDGITFTSPLSCGPAVSCAAGALDNGQPAFITTGNGGHSWTIYPLPAGDGRIFVLSCPSLTTCRALTSANGRPLAPGFASLMASARFVATTDGGRHFTATRFPSGESMQAISCPTTSYCVAVGLYNKTVPTTFRGMVMISRDGGATWRPGTLSGGLNPWLFPQISCPDTAHCWMIGAVHGDGHSVMAVSADGGATWTVRHLPATVPDPQLFSLACLTAATCYVAGEDSPPPQIGSSRLVGGAMVAVTRDGGVTWSRVSLPMPAHVPAGVPSDSFMAIGTIQCPQADTCIALGVSDQGSKTTPVYTSNP